MISLSSFQLFIYNLLLLLLSIFQFQIIRRRFQEVEQNKKKNMGPLWTAAKKTVDGGIKDLKEIIEKKKKTQSAEDESYILKLEVLERDLEIISMVSC